MRPRHSRGAVGTAPLRVLIIYKDLPHYRVRFFELLRERLAQRGVELSIVYGDPVGASRLRRDKAELEWATRVKNHTLTLFGRTLYWQPVLGRARHADLVIVEQASRLLVNYLLVGMNAVGLTRLALWGHGRNLQSKRPEGMAERFKRFYSKRVHWWFAYNESSARIVRDLGFPAERITVAENAIDTTTLARQVRGVDPLTAQSLREKLGVSGRNVCLYIGGMYPEKRVPLLVEAAEIIRGRVDDFELVLIGAGPDQDVAQEAAARWPWAHYAGPLFAEDLAQFLAIGRLLLMPGAVGLGILDSFAAGVPAVATGDAHHGPEIEYLEDDVNGIIVPGAITAESFAVAVVGLLNDDTRRERLVEGCERSASRYTVERMADEFAEGVVKALGNR